MVLEDMAPKIRVAQVRFLLNDLLHNVFYQFMKLQIHIFHSLEIMNWMTGQTANQRRAKTQTIRVAVMVLVHCTSPQCTLSVFEVLS